MSKKDKRLPIEGSIPNWDTPWDNGTSAYNTTQVREFLKEQSQGKMGILHQDGNKVLVFTDADARARYLEDRVNNAHLLLGTFDAPAEFKAQITLLTPQSQTMLKGDTAAPIRFSFRTLNSSNQPQGEKGNVTFDINASGNKYTVTQLHDPDTEITFDPSPYIKNAGNATVTIKVSGMATLASTSVAVAYRVVDLLLSDSRDPFNIGAVHDPQDRLAFAYEIAGYGSKHMQWYIDGEALPEISEDTASTPREERIKYIDISGLAPGAHTLQVRSYIVDAGQPFYSQTLFRTFFVEGAPGVGVALDLAPGTLVTDTITIEGLEQYVQTSLRVSAYDPVNAQGVPASVRLMSGDTAEATANIVALRGQMYSVTLTPMTPGSKTIEISTADASLTLTAEVSRTSTGLSENTQNRILALSAQGKDNSAADRVVWESNGIACSFSGMDWNASSGWTGDGLRLGESSVVTVGSSGMLDGATRTGKTVEVELQIEDTTDDDAVILDMTQNGAGLLIASTYARLTSDQGQSVEVRFAEGRNWRIGVTIERPTDSGGLASIYINGVHSGAVDFPRSATFGTALMRLLGAEGVTPVIKSIWGYDVALNKDQMLDNYILTRPTSQEMLAAFSRNNIRDDFDATKLDPDKVASTGVPVVKITANLGPLQGLNQDKTLRTESRGEGKIDTLEFIDNAHPWRNFTINNVSIRPQGTSSMEFWVKNFRPDAKYYKNAEIIQPSIVDYQGNVIPQKFWSMWLNSIPVNLWCLKADYMESSGTHNTGIARLWNDLLKNAKFTNAADIARFGEYPLRTMAQQAAIDNGYDKDVRTCIDGFPIVLFTRYDEDEAYQFAGKYNWNNDKSTEAVFGFCDIPGFDNSNVECWEVLNSSNQLALFETTEGWDNGWTEAFESRYPDGSTNTTNLKSFAKWLVSVKNNPEAFAEQKYAHLDVPKTAAYYVYLMMHGAVDQTVKNAMFTTENGVNWFFDLYDNDTTHGLINAGSLILGPYINRQSIQPGSEDYAYAGHGSVLWNMLEADAEFMDVVGKVAKILYEAGLTIDGMLDMFNVQQAGQWSERIYNADADLKYVQVWRNGYDNRLYALQGSRTSHRTWWLSRRFAFLESLLMLPSFRSNAVSMRLRNPDPGQTFRIKAGLPIYLAWSEDNTYKQTGVYADADSGVVEFVTDTVTPYGSPLYFFGAPYMSEFDMSGAMEKLSTISLAGFAGQGTRLTKLVLGSPNKTNTEAMFNSLNFSAFKALRHLDVRGYPTLTSVDISGLTKLSTFLATGTSLGSFDPERGCRITEAALPGTVTAITLRDLPALTNAGLTFASLGSLRTVSISGCTLDTRAFVSQWITAVGDANLGECSLSLGRVDWRNASVADMIKLGSIGELNMTGVVNLAAAPANETELEQLRSIYGRDCFSDSAQLRLKAPGDLMLVAPSSVLEGSEFTVELINIAGGELTALTMTATGAAGVSYTTDTAAQTMRIVVEETGANRSFPISVQCLVGGQAQALSRRVTVNKRTYPTGYVLDGDRYIANGGSTALTLEESGSGITGHCSVVWSIEDVADEGEGAVVDTAASLLEIADGGESGCTVRFREGASVSNEDVCRSATVTAKMYRGLDTDPAAPYKTVTLRVAAHNGLVAVSKAANPEVFAVCKDQNWCAHESYMTLAEAETVTSLPSFSGRSHLYLRELRHFTAVTSIPGYAFVRCPYINIILPPNITSLSNDFNTSANARIIVGEAVSSVGDSCFAVCPNSRIEFLRTSTFTTGNYTFGSCAETELIFHTDIPPTRGSNSYGTTNLKIYAPATADRDLYENLGRRIAISYTISYTL